MGWDFHKPGIQNVDARLFLSNLPENPELLNSGMNGARSEA